MMHAPAARWALVGLLALVASPASAETVTYHLVGTITSVTDGQLNTIDLRGTFVVGHTFTVDVTVNRSLPPIASDGTTFIYSNAGTAFSFLTDSYSCSGTEFNSESITNDLAPTPGTLLDEFTYNASGLIAPPIGGATSSVFTFDFVDNEGTALTSGTLPRTLPALTEFETRSFSLGFADPVLQRAGVVIGEFGSATTPALDTSWGRIKGLYR